MIFLKMVRVNKQQKENEQLKIYVLKYIPMKIQLCLKSITFIYLKKKTNMHFGRSTMYPVIFTASYRESENIQK